MAIVHGGESKVIIWLWEKSKCFALATITNGDFGIPTHLSFSLSDNNVLLITG